jgi:hypothetical protein
MKKSIFNFMNYSIYRYAPESFKLLLLNKNVTMSSELASELGNITITKGKQEAMKRIKQVFRKESIYSPIIRKKKLAIKLDNGEYITISHPYGWGTVNRYNINEKLEVYKELKKAYLQQNFNIKITEGKMTSYGKFEAGKEVKQDINNFKGVFFM